MALGDSSHISVGDLIRCNRHIQWVEALYVDGRWRERCRENEGGGSRMLHDGSYLVIEGPIAFVYTDWSTSHPDGENFFVVLTNTGLFWIDGREARCIQKGMK